MSWSLPGRMPKVLSTVSTRRRWKTQVLTRPSKPRPMPLRLPRNVLSNWRPSSKTTRLRPVLNLSILRKMSNLLKPLRTLLLLLLSPF
uniref:Uncharacterized protein n=1 Tax=Arundo donax TaxID=35708 RepID=A0A0A9AXR1_ARUDO